MLYAVYREYLLRLKDGIDDRKAKDFTKIHVWGPRIFPELSTSELQDVAVELCNQFGMKYYTRSGFNLNPQFIAYAEGKNGRDIKHVTDALRDFLGSVGEVLRFLPL